MKKVLYLTNIEAPYRTKFFAELAKHCDLTVLYERKRSSNRDASWSNDEQCGYRRKFLHGMRIKHENAFSLGIIKEIFSGYDRIIVGCFNSPVQMLAILTMRLFRIPYILNMDGDPFLKGTGLKAKLKAYFLKGANKYLVAGEKTVQQMKEIVGERVIVPYYFSSLSRREVEAHRNMVQSERNDTILVVGQYFYGKGMDVALEAARMDGTLKYKFVGMGNKTEEFLQNHEVPANVEIIPFLQKAELERQYQSCAMLLLPSREDCWGLVVNEAASFGMPIVSTWGSGAAVEFMADDYAQYLAKPADAESLYHCIRRLAASPEKTEYSAYLVEKSKNYHVEHSVQAHLAACDI